MKVPVVNSHVVALDVGEKRVGVALADVQTRLPWPLTTLVVSNRIANDIDQILTKYNSKVLVVGYPRNQAGEPTAQTAEIEQFIRQLKLGSGIKIFWQDESVTSVRAESELQQRGVAYEKGDIDSLAATYILEDYLREHV